MTALDFLPFFAYLFFVWAGSLLSFWGLGRWQEWRERRSTARADGKSPVPHPEFTCETHNVIWCGLCDRACPLCEAENG